MGIRPTSPTRPMTPDQPHGKHSFRSGVWQKLHTLFGKDESPHPQPGHGGDAVTRPALNLSAKQSEQSTAPCRPVGIGLPRQTTFKRQNSERRDRLLPVDPLPAERRAVSSSRHNSSACCRRSRSTPPTFNPFHTSVPVTSEAFPPSDTTSREPPVQVEEESLPPSNEAQDNDIFDHDITRLPRPVSVASTNSSVDDERYEYDTRAQLNSELDTRWILNLSMHFRDKSDREKFFITYAERPNKWRRVTVSCDYRNAEPDSLEMDLKELQFQRDKSLQIYEAIRDSLADIQFYDTVTNLKLVTSEGRMHVHVTEDVNEIIPYPPRSTVRHILEDAFHPPLEVADSDLSFESHLSGFVYKVRHRGKTYIKKEIPGPDTVDEFLYEINALQALHDSDYVIKLKGIVMDDQKQVVKGLLIDYADRGAVVDLLYDHKGQIPWESRVRWARHAVKGLRDIHEEGYVQGDFTLSNIVVDDQDNAKIIDINRRGCPVGWEPPEIAAKIASNQRISMYIGEKSDIYQLGMSLWALAMDDDEPERHDPPLSTDEFPSEVPEWFQAIVRICLAQKPRDRLSAKELVKLFPSDDDTSSWDQIQLRPNLTVRTEKQYIDPAAAVERDDLERFSRERKREEVLGYSPESSRNDYTFTWPKSSNYDLDHDSISSNFERGRRPPTNIEHLSPDERAERYPQGSSMAQSDDDRAPHIVSISPSDERQYDELEMDGKPYLVSRGTFSEEQLRILGGLTRQESTSNEKPKTHQDRAPSPSVLPQNTSGESESTPRNSHVQLPLLNTAEHEEKPKTEATPVSAIQKPPNDTDDSLTAKNGGQVAVEPSSDNLFTSEHLAESISNQHSEPVTDQGEVQEVETTNSSNMEQEAVAHPPQLRYTDSGFHEPHDNDSNKI